GASQPRGYKHSAPTERGSVWRRAYKHSAPTEQGSVSASWLQTFRSNGAGEPLSLVATNIPVLRSGSGGCTPGSFHYTPSGLRSGQPRARSAPHSYPGITFHPFGGATWG